MTGSMTTRRRSFIVLYMTSLLIKSSAAFRPASIVIKNQRQQGFATVSAMWPFSSSSSSVGSVTTEMQHAEDRLLRFAKRFVLPSQQSTSLKITLHDTFISKASVPHFHDAKACFSSACGDKKTDDSSYTIHSVQVTDTASDSKSSNKTPLVLLHGYMNASSYFYRNFGGLASYFSTVHSLDSFGWGMSSRPAWPKHLTTRQAEDVLVESLEAWRAAQQPSMPKMILAGHSMGGYMAVAYAERYPQHVERLLLLSPAGVPEETPEVVQQRKDQLATRPWTMRFLFYVAQRLFMAQYTPGSILRTLSTSRGHGWVSNYVEKRLPAITDSDERKAVSDYLYWNSIMPSSSEHSLSQILKPNAMGRDPLVNRVPKLKVSHVTFLYGSHDWMDVEGGLQVQENVQHLQKQQSSSSNAATPKVEVYRVEQAGHLLMLDNWREFNQGVILGAGGEPTDPDYVPTKLDVSLLTEKTEQDKPIRSYNELNRITRRPTGMASA